MLFTINKFLIIFEAQKFFSFMCQLFEVEIKVRFYFKQKHLSFLYGSSVL